MKNFHPTTKDKKGMALIVALLVSAIVLSIGINIANVAAKQIVLSSFNKESHKALFMADAALECVLFWDQTTEFNTQYPGADASGDYFFRRPGTSPSQLSNGTVSCFSDGAGFQGSIPMNDRGTGGGNSPSTIDLDFELRQGVSDQLSCARVILHKEINAGAIVTTLKTLGYNTCDPANPRRVERGLEIEY